GAGAVEGAASDGGGASAGRGRDRRRDARSVHDVDADPGQPRARSGRSAAGAGTPRSAVTRWPGTWHVPGTYLARTWYVPGTLVSGRTPSRSRRASSPR